MGGGGWIGGLTQWATLAALLGSLGALAQLYLSHRHEKTRRRQRYVAVRAAFPLTLSGICDYAISAGRSLRDLHRELSRASDDGAVEYQGTQLPPELVTSLQEMIEATHDRSAVDAIAELISELQVLASRVRDLIPSGRQSRAGVLHNVEVYILQSAEIYARASSMFDFARRRSDAIAGPTANGITTALHLLDLLDSQMPGLDELVAKEVARLEQPRPPRGFARLRAALTVSRGSTPSARAAGPS